MTKEQRGELLRTRFKAKGGIPYAPTCKTKPKPACEPRKKVYMPWPDIIVDHKRTPGWLLKSDTKPDFAPKPDRRRKGDSALTRIAGKWHKALTTRPT